MAAGFLRKAINNYLKGLEADWRDAYPGINALTLMGASETIDPRQVGLMPVVRYSVNRRLAGKNPDYWDYATLLELAVLASDRAEASQALADSRACQPDTWQAETTADNLQLILDGRRTRGEEVDWLTQLISCLREPTLIV